jgi:glyoxylase-like metal-dependent hydrolase (beta-lactamase superfamily II)
LEAELAWPTVTFSDELHLDLGDKHLRLFPAPGHSADGICVYLEEAAILFAADTVVTGIVPAIFDGDSRQLETSLHKLLDIPVEILVAGHGPILHGRSAIQNWLQQAIDYLAGIRNEVRQALSRGDSPEAIVEAVDYDTFVGDRLPREKFGMEKRHRQTVQKIVTEIIEMDQTKEGG